MPWHLPDDLKFFKATTKDHVMIMGRKTFESFPAPLPGRPHVVISSNGQFQAKNKPDGTPPVLFTDSWDKALSIASKITEEAKLDRIFVVGGGQLFEQTISKADELILTHIDAAIDGVIYFPEVNLDHWKEVWSLHHPKDEKHPYSFTFRRYERK